MGHVIDGYVVIILQMLAGVVVGTFGVLGKGADGVLNRLAFTVLAPCLLYTLTFRADLGSIPSSAALVAVLSATTCMATFVVTARLWWGRPVRTAETDAILTRLVDSVNVIT
jgi:malonate transporter and related proteins